DQGNAGSAGNGNGGTATAGATAAAEPATANANALAGAQGGNVVTLPGVNNVARGPEMEPHDADASSRQFASPGSFQTAQDVRPKRTDQALDVDSQWFLNPDDLSWQGFAKGGAFTTPGQVDMIDHDTGRLLAVAGEGGRAEKVTIANHGEGTHK